MTSRPHAPAGAPLTPAQMVAGILKLNPNYNPPPSRHQIMAENLTTLGERALAMNPIRLASSTGGALARGTRTRGPSVVIPVFPRNSRAPIPVPDPRRPGEAGKDRSRLPQPDGVPHRPGLNPGRVPKREHALTVAPKGGRARSATDVDATQYSPDDSFGDTLYKVGQNSGDDLETIADLAIPEVRHFLGDTLGDLTEYGIGYLQTLTPREQKREDLVDDMREHNRRRYGNPGAFTNNPISTIADGLFANRFGFYGLPTVSGLADQRRKREKEEPSE